MSHSAAHPHALPRARRPLALRILLGIVLFILFLIIAAAAVLFLVPDKVLQSYAGGKGSAALGRAFSIDGPIKIEWDWQTPRVHIAEIHLANFPDAKDPYMLSIQNLDFHIEIWKLLEGQLNLPDITLDHPHIVLEKFSADKKNWDFPTVSKASAASSAALPSSRSNMPVFGNLTIKGGELEYRDDTKNVALKLKIDTASAGGGEEGDFTVSGTGALQGKVFEIKAQGGSLDMLRNSSKAYPLNLHLKMGATEITVDGTFTDPVKMEGVDTKLDIRGDDLADLFYLTQIPLPPTPSYSLSGRLTKKGQVWAFESFKGKVGDSDIEGDLSYDTSGERGYMKAMLNSHLLNMKDLAGFLGENGADEKADAKAAAKTDDKPKRLLPDIPLDLTRLRATDLDAELKAAQVLQPGLPMNDMDIGFHLKNGVLRLDPFDVGIAKGKISGSLVLDGSQDLPRVETDLSISKLSLKQFFAGTSFEPLSEGFIGGHFAIAGSGHSLAEVLADSNGRVTAAMSGGTISQLVVSAAGLDLGHAAPLLIDKDKPVGVRCLVTDFDDKNGMLNSKVLVFDTTASNISGDAKINLKDETIDASIEASPKHTSIAAGTAITVSGPLSKPSIGLDPKEEGARVGAAVALSAFLTPLAAIIPFIELGLGEDSDCKDLIAQAKKRQAAPVAPSESSPPGAAH